MDNQHLVRERTLAKAVPLCTAGSRQHDQKPERMSHGAPPGVLSAVSLLRLILLLRILLLILRLRILLLVGVVILLRLLILRLLVLLLIGTVALLRYGILLLIGIAVGISDPPSIPIV